MLPLALALLVPPLLALQQLEKTAESVIGQLSARVPVTDISLRTYPSPARVRPFETLVVQVLAYGKDGESKVRLRRGGPQVKAPAGGGWVSKPFAFQGNETEAFFNESKSFGWNLFGNSAGAFVAKDCVLYTAPETPGRYKLEAELDRQRAEIEIEVTAEAESRRATETVSFPPQPVSADPYRALAEHWAPFLAQETWFEPKADMPVRFDFDGDWDGDNNWDALAKGSSQAYVYYTVMESPTHWFLEYNVFHARDYSDRCVVGTCHENDNEGLILTVAKDGTQFGRLQVMETLAHNVVHAVAADPAVRGGVRTVEGAIEFYEGHPAAFVESGGHGILGTLAAGSRFKLSQGEFDSGTGITLVYKGLAERPRHANDRLIGYELLPMQQEWWTKAEVDKWPSHTFDAPFTYTPFGGRPALARPAVGGAFMGRKEAENKAKPFWGWHDTATLKKGLLAVGQWALDPAYAVNRTLRMPEPFSVDYVNNPYLKLAGAPAAAAAELPEPAAAASGQVEVSVRVDGTAEVRLSGAEIRCQAGSGQPCAVESVSFSAPLPAAVFRANLTRLGGRGKVELIEHPSAANGYAAVIRVDDSRSGSDTYRLRVQWNQ